MGSVCSKTTVITVQGTFDMPGVPAHIAVATFCNMEAAPSFIPIFVSLEILRGQPGQVGTCWLERRAVGKGEILLRKTITKRSDDPHFTQCALTESVESTFWTMPDFISTYTLNILPTGGSSDDRADESSINCSIRWTDAIVSKGFLGRVLSILCVPCLRKTWMAQTQEEWQYYYEEALRRTTTAVRESFRDHLAESSSRQDGK